MGVEMKGEAGSVLVHVFHRAAPEYRFPDNVQRIEAAGEHGREARMLQPRQRYGFVREIAVVAKR